MSLHNLDRLLTPASVAVIGGSDRAGSVGKVLVDNILAGGFAGAVQVVNPRPVSIAGASWHATIDDLPATPDLAVVATPAADVAQVIAALARHGTPAAVVVTAGLTKANGLHAKILEAAKPSGLRIIGPNGLGLMSPHARLNASFAQTGATPGRLALISQSGALVSGVVDWAVSRRIGFSGIVSAGDMADVDLGDLIDLFAADVHTDAILLYVEGITDAAKFLSAARAAARIKPVIALKGGRSGAARQAVASHTGALAGAYDVHACAFERAGVVLVDNLTALFDAASILSAARRPAGGRLAIVTNGGGAGILAVDALGDLDSVGARLASLSPRTLEKMAAVLPDGASRANPLDLRGDAGPERYSLALDATLADENVDAVLVMACPTALHAPASLAAAVAEAVGRARATGDAKPVLACWLGDESRRLAEASLSHAGVPLFETPETAVAGFGYLLAASRARAALMAAPPAHAEAARHRAAAQEVIDAARAQGRTQLTEVEAKALLELYGVPTVETRFAPHIDAVALACEGLSAPYAVKIVSPQIVHKSDVGGVALNLPDAAAASQAAARIQAAVALAAPMATIAGFSVQTMAPPGGHQLIVGLAQDPTFGPVVLVGAGGKAVEVLADRALGLPPLDARLARNMIDHTRISRLLAGYRDEPPAAIDSVVGALEAVSAIAVDLPDVMELDINPLRVDASGALALDARIIIAAEPAASRLAIAPPPMEWSADLTTRAGLGLHVRPVRPDDEAIVADFFAKLSPEDLRMRFLSPVRRLDGERLALITQVDYRRTITFLAFDAADGVLVATAMLAGGPDPERAEVALSVASDLKSQGIGWTLLEHTMRYARARGLKVLQSVESADNLAALRLEGEMGFKACVSPEDMGLRVVERRLDDVPLAV